MNPQMTALGSDVDVRKGRISTHSHGQTAASVKQVRQAKRQATAATKAFARRTIAHVSRSQ